MINILKRMNLYFIHNYGIGLHQFTNLRASALAAKKKFGNIPITCAEIGSWEGENAYFMFKYMNIKHLYIIDPYLSYSEYDEAGKTVQVVNTAYEKMQKRLAPYWDRVTVIRKMSSKVELPENVDYVYVDGNHAYKYAKEDMVKFIKYVKRGGIMGGHDLDLPDVAQAFAEFVGENKLKPHTGANIKSVDWWVER